MSIISKSRMLKNGGFSKIIAKDFVRNRYVYFMILPVLVYFILFHYKPMYGAIIAFKDFDPSLGIMDSPWVGFKHFRVFFSSYYFWRILRNTVLLSIYTLIFEFPTPIILALLINELRNKYFKSTVQTITYLPHFISIVVVCGIIKNFTLDTGTINDLIVLMGGERITMLQQPGMFRTVYVASEIWQKMGWWSIIYLSALSGVDVKLYESSIIDGAGRWKQTWHITLPGIMPTVVVLLILRIGGIMNLLFEKILLLYNPLIYETADVISTYVYRRGLLEFNWSLSSAVGLFNSVINFTLLLTANRISRKVNETSLW